MPIKRRHKAPLPDKIRIPLVEALRISTPYFVAGCLWILLSDKLLLLIPGDVHAIVLLSSLKGWIFVLATAVMIFILVRARARRIWQYKEHLEDMIKTRTADYEKARLEAFKSNEETAKALERTNHLSEFNGLIVHLAQEFINGPVEQIDSKLFESLQRVGQYLNEDRVFLAEYDYCRELCKVTHEWNRPGLDATPGFARPFEHIRDMMAAHERGYIYFVNNTARQPWEEDLETMLKKTGVRSFIAIPVLSRGKPFGFIGISAAGVEKSWAEDDLAMLKVFAELIRNVFEQRNREMLFQANSRNMRVLLDSTQDTIFMVGRDGTIIDLNSAAAELLGRTVEESLGKPIEGLMPASVFSQRGQLLWETFKTGQPGRFMGTRENLWIDTRYFPVFEPDGTVGAVAAFSTDISERVKAENEIFQSRQMLRQVIDNAPVGIFWRDTNNKVLGANKVIAQIAGLTMQDLNDGRGEEYLPVPSDDEINNLQILQSGQPKLNYEASLTDAHGEKHVLRMSKIPLMDQEGKPYLLLGVVVDVTDQKKMIEDLLKARQEAYDASKAKSAFLSMMSHEIRTPLNSIMGLTQIARRMELHGRMEDFLNKIDSSSKHLLGIINDILDISRIEAGKMTLQGSDFDFTALMEETVEIIGPKASEKRQALDVFLDSDIPRRLHADPLRLKQVLVNLLTNAVKFTQELGAVSLRAELAGRTDAQLTIRFSVRDNGVGIPEDKLGSIFNPFEQLGRAMTRDQSGTGLGLAITKTIVELMGGSISVVSAPGEGSEFTILTPMAAAADQSGAQVRFCGLRALVADDEEDAREYMASMLGGFSVPADTAGGGADAIRMASEAMGRGAPYSVAFIDWRMPGLNGIDTAAGIIKACGTHTAVVMISQFDLDEIAGQLASAGITRRLAKPIFPSRLLGVLSEIANRPEAAGTQAGQDFSGIFAGRRILVAEDMDINMMIMREMLRDTGAEILEAANGVQALELFKTAGGAVDAILMDVHMPEKNGYEATREIRMSGLNNAEKVPIIAMTANVFREDVEASMAAGMDGHIGKPIDYQALLSTLREHITGKAASHARGASQAT